MIDFRQHFLAKGQVFNETPSETQQLNDWLNEKEQSFQGPRFSFLCSLLPCAPIILLALAVFGIFPHGWLVPAFLFNLTLTVLYLNSINRFPYFLLGKLP